MKQHTKAIVYSCCYGGNASGLCGRLRTFAAKGWRQARGAVVLCSSGWQGLISGRQMRYNGANVCVEKIGFVKLNYEKQWNRKN